MCIRDRFYINGQERSKLNSIVLNSDGRSDGPLVEKDKFKNGKYELVFYIGEYFKNILKTETTPFLDDVVIRFGISKNNEHYHVPLLVSPWSYSCLLYTSPSPRDLSTSRMPSSA